MSLNATTATNFFSRQQDSTAITLSKSDGIATEVTVLVFCALGIILNLISILILCLKPLRSLITFLLAVVSISDIGCLICFAINPTFYDLHKNSNTNNDHNDGFYAIWIGYMNNGLMFERLFPLISNYTLMLILLERWCNLWFPRKAKKIL